MADLTNPPLNEVAVGAFFNPELDQLRSEHIGLFWSRIREEFPVVEQKPPIGSPELVVSANELLPVPRFWFRSADEANLIQIQRNAFFFNWRRGEAEYPRFSAYVKPTFDDLFSAFESFCREDVGVSEVLLNQCRLSYVNVVRPCDYWTGPGDTSRLLPSFPLPVPSSSGEPPSDFNCHYVHHLADDLDIGLKVRSARSRDTPSVPMLVFEIEAAGQLGQVSKSVADPWYRRAHDAVLDFFLSVTDPGIRDQYWNPVSGAAE